MLLTDEMLMPHPNRILQRIVVAMAAVLAIMAQPADDAGDVSGTRATSTATYHLGPEDVITIWALGVEELPQTPIIIDPQGCVDLPLVGRVRLAGQTIEQATADLKSKYSQFVREPEVTIRITEFRSQPVSVLGAVNSPGIIQLHGRKTLIEVLSLAGGLRSDAGYALKITRRAEAGGFDLPTAAQKSIDGFTVAEVLTRDLISGKSPAENIPILPHDVISVPKADLFYVIGDVRKQGAFVLGEKKTISLLEALSLAEGLLPTAAPSSSRILRKKADSDQRVEIALDLGKIMNGKRTDIELQADDVVFVPSSLAKKISVRAIESAVNLATGILIWR
jgi:polysaccharide export outer membrane protein